MVFERVELPLKFAPSNDGMPQNPTDKQLSDARVFATMRVITNSQLMIGIAGVAACARALYKRTMPSAFGGLMAGAIGYAWISNEMIMYRFSMFVQNSPSGRAEEICGMPVGVRYRPLWYPHDQTYRA